MAPVTGRDCSFTMEPLGTGLTPAVSPSRGLVGDSFGVDVWEGVVVSIRTLCPTLVAEGLPCENLTVGIDMDLPSSGSSNLLSACNFAMLISISVSSFKSSSLAFNSAIDLSSWCCSLADAARTLSSASRCSSCSRSKLALEWAELTRP